MRLIVIFVACLSSTALAGISQWYDGDGDGSLWLSDSVVKPYADLSGQTLWWADLPYANLHHSNLVLTNLSYANLYAANLKVSDLSYAILFGSDLESSFLAFSTLHGADLRSTNINDANLFNVDITDADMTGMQNWETAQWMAARYNDNTVFPEGMDPNNYAMFYMEIPSPPVMLMFLMGVLYQRPWTRS